MTIYIEREISTRIIIGMFIIDLKILHVSLFIGVIYKNYGSYKVVSNVSDYYSTTLN